WTLVHAPRVWTLVYTTRHAALIRVAAGFSLRHVRNLKVAAAVLFGLLFLDAPVGLAQDASAIKEHADHLKQGDSRAAAALVRYGAAAVPALIDVLKEGDAFAKGHAAQA